MRHPGRHRRYPAAHPADTFGRRDRPAPATREPAYMAVGETVRGQWRRHWIDGPAGLLLLIVGLAIDYGVYLVGRIDGDPGLCRGVEVLTLVELVGFGYGWLCYRSARFIVTDRRLIIVRGRVRVRAASIRLNDIVRVGFEQSRMGWRTNYGTVWMEDSAHGSVAVREVVGAEELFLTILGQACGAGVAAVEGRAIAEQQHRFRGTVLYPRSISVRCDQPLRRFMSGPGSSPRGPLAGGTRAPGAGGAIHDWRALNMSRPAPAVDPSVALSRERHVEGFDDEFRVSGLCVCPECGGQPRA